MGAGNYGDQKSFSQNYGASSELERLRRELEAARKETERLHREHEAELAAIRRRAQEEAERARLTKELEAERAGQERLRREHKTALAALEEAEARKTRKAPVEESALNAWDARHSAGTRKKLVIKNVIFAFRYCPPGTFKMGSPASEMHRGSDETQHDVTLTRGFWLLKTPVTQRQYVAITGSNPSYFKSKNDRPAEMVCWGDCQAFCESLNALRVAPKGFEFRLPTEAEWEYACRAGTTTPYSWGTMLNGDKANCNGTYPYGGVSKGGWLRRTSAVGSYPANPWGLYDMHGNVWEWCADWYGDYGLYAQTNPTGPTSGSKRIARGGDWFNGPSTCRSAERIPLFPSYKGDRCGFRLVLSRKR